MALDTKANKINYSVAQTFDWSYETFRQTPISLPTWLYLTKEMFNDLEPFGVQWLIRISISFGLLAFVIDSYTYNSQLVFHRSNEFIHALVEKGCLYKIVKIKEICKVDSVLKRGKYKKFSQWICGKKNWMIWLSFAYNEQ